MMETLQNTAASICMTLVVTGIFTMLLPDENWNRYARFAVRLFLLLCLVVPFVGKDFQWDFDTDTYMTQGEAATENLQEFMDEQLCEQFAQNLEEELTHALEAKEIYPENVEVQVHIVDSRRIDISNIILNLREEDASRWEEAAYLTEETLGVFPETATSE